MIQTVVKTFTVRLTCVILLAVAGAGLADIFRLPNGHLWLLFLLLGLPFNEAGRGDNAPVVPIWAFKGSTGMQILRARIKHRVFCIDLFGPTGR